jgi:O-antigen biosynthesis protein
MHRSGTSVMTRALQVIGVPLGDNLIEPIVDINPKGFWEDAEINLFDQELLRFIESDWHDVRPVTTQQIEKLIENGYLQKATEILTSKFADTNLFGLKDPRIAKLLPFWQQVFKECNLEVNYVIALRNPLSIAESLKKRDGFTLERSILLWMDHTFNAVLHTQKNKRLVVDYDKLIQNPTKQINRIANSVGPKINADALDNFKNDFLDKNLRHKEFKFAEIKKNNKISQLTKDLFALLSKSSEINNLTSEVINKNELAKLVNRYGDLREALTLISDSDKRYREALTLISDSDKRYQAEYYLANQKYIELAEQLTEKEQKLIDLNNHVLHLNSQLLDLQNELLGTRLEINEIKQSQSWMLTKPLRQLKSLIKN